METSGFKYTYIYIYIYIAFWCEVEGVPLLGAPILTLRLLCGFSNAFQGSGSRTARRTPLNRHRPSLQLTWHLTGPDIEEDIYLDPQSPFVFGVVLCCIHFWGVLSFFGGVSSMFGCFRFSMRCFVGPAISLAVCLT